MPDSILVIGRESVGKSQLIASLTGKSAHPANFRGSTVAVETYSDGAETWIDTPGLWHQSDAATTRETLGALETQERVLLVAQATHLDEDLAELLPLARGKKGAVVVTFWDKVAENPRARQALERVGRDLELELVPVDARRLDEAARKEIRMALDNARLISGPPREKIGWRVEPKTGPLENRIFGPILALFLLFFPAIVAVYTANTFGAFADPLAQGLLKPLIAALEHSPALLHEITIGRYGLVTMGPLLFVWAIPTVVLYAFFLGLYKASGLIDRATVALDPLLRPIGLAGRDLVRVVMGWGCNVPAVIATRSCGSCSRGTCVSAIAFGAACSYQFGATLGIFAAAKRPELVWPFLAYLGATTLIYTRLSAPQAARTKTLLPLVAGRNFLEWPRFSAVWREARGTLRGFFVQALPVFFAITILASLLDYCGVLTAFSGVLAPLMGLFHLPADAALPVILASIRKDGILLLAEGDLAKKLSAGQILTGVYLAGTLFPCLVTVLSIGREMKARFALRLLVRQAGASLIFTLVLAWACYFLGF